MNREPMHRDDKVTGISGWSESEKRDAINGSSRENLRDFAQRALGKIVAELADRQGPFSRARAMQRARARARMRRSDFRRSRYPWLIYSLLPADSLQS